MSEQRVKERVLRYFQEKIPEAQDMVLAGFDKNTEGWSQETFCIDLKWREKGEEVTKGFVIRRVPVAGLLEPYDQEPEFRALQSLEGTGVPAPEVFWFERDPQILDRAFYVMEKVDGDVPIPMEADDTQAFESDTERDEIGRQFVEALAKIHAIDWKAKGLSFLCAPKNALECATREIEWWEERITRDKLEPLPVLTEAFLWLKNNKPAEGEITLVHGDYRTGNFIVRDGRIVAILDWEMVHLGDPMEDLGWACMIAWRGMSPRMSCLLPREALYSQYEKATGRKVNENSVQFYEALGAVKMTAIMLTATKTFHDGRSTDLRLATFDHQLAGMLAGVAQAIGL